jgi:hypothetical protein
LVFQDGGQPTKRGGGPFGFPSIISSGVLVGLFLGDVANSYNMTETSTKTLGSFFLALIRVLCCTCYSVSSNMAWRRFFPRAEVNCPCRQGSFSCRAETPGSLFLFLFVSTKTALGLPDCYHVLSWMHRGPAYYR